MPRKPKIPHEELKAAILRSNGVIDGEGSIPGPSNSVWYNINSIFNGALTCQYIYQYVKENRYNILAELRQQHGIESPTFLPSLRTSESSITTETGSSSDSTGHVASSVHTIKPQKTFTVIIPAKEWEKIKPVEKTYRSAKRNLRRRYNILPPLQWTPIISDLLWEQHKIPCPYSFKRSTVYSNLTWKDKFVIIRAVCNECRAKATGHILQEPASGSDVQLLWRANDTRLLPHKSKRHLCGERRKLVGSIHLKNASAAVYRKLSAKTLMDQGDVEAPHLYNAATLRKAKQEHQDSALNVVQGSHPLLSLAVMKHSEPYAGMIKDIWLDKTVVHYSTPAQMLLYKQYCKKTYTRLSVDATGGLVKKIKRVNDLSGHIFLFEIVIHTGEHQFPVLQMLSEKQDANTILYWLNEWERSGAPCPKEVNTDNSQAIKSALARSFGRSKDLNEYAEKCFMYLTGKTKVLPPCFIRLDVAHFLNAARKWKIWRSKERMRLMDFYLRCLGVLIKTTNLENFSEILINILTLATNPNEGKECEGKLTRVELSLQFLAAKIRGAEELPSVERHDGKETLEDIGIETEFIHDGSESSDDDDDVTARGQIRVWFKEKFEIVEKAMENQLTGRLNPYYCPDFAGHLKRICYEFTLWSAVMVGSFHSPYLTSTSAPVESDFCDLKKRVLKGSSETLRIDRFVATHLQYIEGSCRIAGAPKKKRNNKENEVVVISNEKKGMSLVENELPEIDSRLVPQNDEKEDFLKSLALIKNRANINESVPLTSDDAVNSAKGSLCSDSNSISDEEGGIIQEPTFLAPNDLNEIENWRGLAKRGIRRESRYLVSIPHFEAAVQAKRLKQPSKRLLLNGNKLPFVKTSDGYHVQIKNTCAFDAACQVLSESYITVPAIREYFDLSKNTLIKTARSLAVDGAVTLTYQLRTQCLTNVLRPQNTIKVSDRKTRNTNSSVLGVQYDCWTNMATLIKQLLSRETLIHIVKHCANSGCSEIKYFFSPIIEANFNTIVEQGMSSLNTALILALQRTISRHVNEHVVSQLKELDNIKTDKCSSICSYPSSTVFKLEKILIIDLEAVSHPEIRKMSGGIGNYGPYALREFPENMKLCGNLYQITGLVAYRPSHYVAYTRRSQGRWEIFDDLCKAVISCKEDEKVYPQIVMYIQV